MKKKGALNFPLVDCLLGFDAEWTKNYKIKNGNIPFCFSVVAVNKKDLSLEKLRESEVSFRYLQFYCEAKEDVIDLISSSNEILGRIMECLGTCTLCGHQVSSDFSTLLNFGKAASINGLSNIERAQQLWHIRKAEGGAHIVDTRYDIFQPFMGKSRRLVDMCNDFLLDVTQPELNKTSMTKLQNQYYAFGDNATYEKIAVMNLRHSLCAIVLFWLNTQINQGDQITPININRIVHKTLKDDFGWVSSSVFLGLL